MTAMELEPPKLVRCTSEPAEDDKTMGDTLAESTPEEETKTNTPFTSEPEQKMSEDDEKRVKSPPTCESCKKEVSTEDRACSACGYYIPKAGETFDLSKVNFNLPDSLMQRLRATQHQQDRHDRPFPQWDRNTETGAFGREANEWILNKLPLQENEKREFLQDLTQEHFQNEKKKVITQRTGKRKTELQLQSEETKQSKIDLTGSGERETVKTQSRKGKHKLAPLQLFNNLGGKRGHSIDRRITIGEPIVTKKQHDSSTNP